MTLTAMSKYDTYKDSGVEGIGKIPSTWRLKKAKWLFSKVDRPVRIEDEIVTCFRDGQVTLRSNRRTEGFTNALKEHGYQGIRVGDLVIHAMDAFAGAIGVSDSNGKSTPVYSVCVPRNEKQVNPFFYAYYLRDLALSGYIVSLAKGIRERSTDFRFSDFSQLFLPLPEISEQIAIVNFLDQKTALIDEAIVIKEQQITQLNERKQILIQQAVIKGLNQNAPMKKSGVDWVGDIPEHWSLQPGFIVFNENKKSNKGMIESQVLSLSYGKIIVKAKEKLNGLVPESFETYQVVSPGNIIIRCTDLQNDKTSLRTGFVKNHGIITSAYLCLNISLEQNAEYIHYFLHALDVCKEIYRYGSGLRQSLSFSDFKRMLVITPPIEEQDQIVTFIREQEENTMSAVELLKTQIEKLTEYKKSLIHSAVTGNIKVI
ncbi:restriction endonuclease subunit S [Aeromonas hydrophila]|uniref:restriction endonuclease subunit S n=1 Tax=Aeromonas TaxID=642 RepID=UPI00191E468C|nr:MULTISPECIES: restriction endonuclease subunit S [Aeromonas]MBL0639884.1 restriction endonuclease subunit S [Aeromonas veronii]USJ77494.1 restriction endonuclease subunit S [Aeromonas hydrophila]